MVSGTEIAGMFAKSAVITDNCRGLHGEMKAFDIAMRQLRDEYRIILEARKSSGQDKRIDYHVALTVADADAPPPGWEEKLAALRKAVEAKIEHGGTRTGGGPTRHQVFHHGYEHGFEQGCDVCTAIAHAGGAPAGGP